MPFLYIFPAWSLWDTVKAVVWSTTGVSILQGSEPHVAFLRKRWEEVLESAKVEGGLLEEDSGGELNWAQSHPCCLLREIRVTSHSNYAWVVPQRELAGGLWEKPESEWRSRDPTLRSPLWSPFI